MILGAALLCLAGCNKTETTMAPPHLKLDLTIHNQMAPATTGLYLIKQGTNVIKYNKK